MRKTVPYDVPAFIAERNMTAAALAAALGVNAVTIWRYARDKQVPLHFGWALHGLGLALDAQKAAK